MLGRNKSNDQYNKNNINEKGSFRKFTIWTRFKEQKNYTIIFIIFIMNFVVTLLLACCVTF